MAKRGERIDISGMRFGKLVVIKFSHSGPRDRNSHWLCRCDCGRLTTVGGSDLKAGKTKSCGKHALWFHFKHEYTTWRVMHARCKGKYQDRGITICKRWESFENFLADMGKKPGSEYTIERVNNNGNYGPDNCKWATAKEQARNRRNNHLIQVGEKQNYVLKGWDGNRIERYFRDFYVKQKVSH